MKTICTLILFLIVISSFSQSNLFNFDSLSFTDVVFEKQKQKGMQFLIDSSHLYIGDSNNQWVLHTRNISTARNSDGNLTAYDAYRLDDNQNMILAEKGFISYHDSTIKEKYFIKGIDYPFAGYNDTIYYNEYNSLGLPVIYMHTHGNYDSIISIDKKIMNYNGTLLTEEIFKAIDPEFYGDNNYHFVKKNILTYNQYDYIKSILSLQWDLTNNVWDTSSINIYNYNSNNNIISTTLSNYIDNQWTTISIDSFIYNSNNQLIKRIKRGKSIQTNNLENFSKHEYIYNTNGKTTTISTYYWENNQWEGYTKYHTFYVNGLKTAKIKYIGPNLFPNITGWEFQTRELYSYNQFDSISSVIFQYYDSYAINWKNFSRREYFYNSNGEVFNSNDYVWDDTTSSWILTRNSQRIFDSHNNLTDYILKSTYNGILMKQEKHSYFYTQLPASLQDIQSTKISVYPNPTSKLLIIKHNENAKIKDVEIYTVEGRLVDKHFNTNIINVESLDNSVYFIKVEYDNGESFIEKFIKK